jgi:50S ribosomal subunit-associated GTPase HflX
MDSVKTVLDELGCGKKETLTLLNKIDVVRSISLLESAQTVYPGAICISAKMGMNLEKVAQAVSAKLKGGEVVVRIVCDAGRGKIQSFIRANGTIISERYIDNTVEIEARLGRNQLPLLERLRPGELEIVE